MAKRAAYPSGLAVLILVFAVTSSATGDGFLCNSRGLVSKPGACHEYYICMRGEGELPILAMCNPPHHYFVEVSQACQPEPPLNRSICTPAIEEEPLGESTLSTTAPTLSITVPTLSTAAPVNAEEPTLSIDQETDAGVGSGGYVQHPTRATDVAMNVSDSDQVVVNSSIADDHGEEYVSPDSQEDQQLAPAGTSQPVDTYNATSRPAEEELTLCDHENIIGKYVLLVIGSPLSGPQPHQEQYNVLIEEYNRNMMQAKNNAHLWIQGESIVMGLKRVHMKATEYQHEFPRKFASYKKQIHKESTRKKNPQRIQRLQEDVRRLRENIRLTNNTLQLTDDSVMKMYLETNIATTEREIERKEKEINGNPEEIKFRTMKAFLSSVSDPAAEVRDLAKEVLDQTELFLANVGRDTDVYEKLIKNYKNANKRLDGKFNDTRNELKEAREQQEQLKTQKEELEATLKGLHANRSTAIEELKLVREEKQRKETKYVNDRIKLCTTSIIFQKYAIVTLNPYDSHFCDILMKSHNIILDIKNETEKIEKLSLSIDMINANFSSAGEEKQTIYPEQKELFDVPPSLREKLEQLEFERNNIKSNSDQLLELMTRGNMATKSITGVMNQIRDLRKQYEDIVGSLQAMTNDANLPSRDKQRNDTENTLGEQRIDIENRLEVLQPEVENHEFESINNCPEV